MSPVSRRFLVTALDFTRYEIVVEARSEADAINKAQGIYGFHGSYEEFEAADSTVRWTVIPLAGEVRS